MKYILPLMSICIIVLLLSLAGTLWRDSERQYVAITDLALRLKELRQITSGETKFNRGNWPSWEVSWKPIVLSMQTEAQRAIVEEQGFHIQAPMYQQLAQFAGSEVGSQTAFLNALTQLDFSDAVVGARLPIVFSGREKQSSMLAVDKFRNEVASILSREAAYSVWLSPILYEQRSHDRSVVCKTQKDVDAFRIYWERLHRRCASATSRTRNKWKVCGEVDEPVARQMKELQTTAETNLKKFKLRWPIIDGEDICSDL